MLIKNLCEMRRLYLNLKILITFITGLLSSVEIMCSTEKADTMILDIAIDYSNDPFYSEIWFWIIIAVFLLFLLILLIRGGRRKSKPEPEVLE